MQGCELTVAIEGVVGLTDRKSKDVRVSEGHKILHLPYLKYIVLR